MQIKDDPKLFNEKYISELRRQHHGFAEYFSKHRNEWHLLTSWDDIKQLQEYKYNLR